ncbi:MAG TPA: murein biosynthesis integral membrane protein MurJ [Candidatus Polarisedimenticolia bacterium]|nr:murein biosynthesis integral membrane protein MurJ [Candidatus Polarisedimenticolia bacterium]
MSREVPPPPDDDDAAIPSAVPRSEAAPPAAPPPGRPAAGREAGLARAAGVVSLATLASRALGLIREQVFAAFFGAGFAVDAFQVAFRIPNLLRDLFAEGAMSAAFVPTLTRVQEREGPEAAMRLANLVMNFLLVTVSAVCLLGILFADRLVPWMAPGFGQVPGKLELTTQMTRIMTPFLLLVALAAAVMGVLNTRRIFFIPAIAPTMLNIALIASGFLLSPLCPRFGLHPIVGMAGGVILGGLGQLLIQVPALYAQGFRWRPEISFRDPGVLRIVTLMAPAAIGLAATQVNIFVNTFLASLLPQGSVSWLNYAYRLMQLPIGLFGVAIATVTLAEVSRHAARREMPELKRTISFSLRFGLFLTLPATMLLVALAHPIVALLYQHGRFLSTDSWETAHALWGYALGLSAFSAVRVLVPVYYSLGMTRVPVTISFVTIAVNIGLNVALMGPLRHGGLALATSIASVLNFVLLFEFLRRKIGPMGGRLLARSGLKILLASLLAAGAAYGVATGLERTIGLASVGERLLVVLAGLAAATVVYVTATFTLRIQESAPFYAFLARFLPGKR